MNYRPLCLTLLLINPLFCAAVPMSAGDSLISEKIKYMQKTSGTDQSLMATYIQSDQAFTQWCGKTATVKDLKRISLQEGFAQIYEQISHGKALGMSKTKALLINDNQKFCKD